MQYFSLYEYNGNHRAPAGVGKLIHALAKKQKVFVKTQRVCQGGFDGVVCMYPESFLDRVDIKTGKIKKAQQTKCL